MEISLPYKDCTIENNLVKIEREHFYSITQTETFISKCGDNVIEVYQAGNFNQNAVIVFVIIFAILGLFVMGLYDKIKERYFTKNNFENNEGEEIEEVNEEIY